jgi:hypothetical protein
MTVAGLVPGGTAISLKSGWNMISFPSFNSSYTVAHLKSDLGLPGVRVEVFDSSAAPYNLQRAPDAYLMLAGEAYWVYTPSDTIWIVPN